MSRKSAESADASDAPEVPSPGVTEVTDNSDRPSEDLTLRLSTVKLERFKAAFTPEEIPLRPFSVLIGRNGSGKSTLLEALQWLDATIRRDAREASDRYFGIHDLINLRSQTKTPFFELTVRWACIFGDGGNAGSLSYRVRVEEAEGNVPRIAAETLWGDREGGESHTYVQTHDDGSRLLLDSQLMIRDPDRLSLGVLSSLTREPSSDPYLLALSDFWSRAVFLRLSPNRLAESSAASRRSFDPLLDEEGQKLAALLDELGEDERAELVQAIQRALPDIRDIEVVKAGVEREARLNYKLLERMPYRGRTGRYQVPIPSWMLSEGTRRLTAILALLVRQPGPTLLCVEEIENGLDPWNVLEVLNALRDATLSGVQVIITTHSPWILDHVELEDITQVRRVEGETRYESFKSREEVAQFVDSIPPGTRYVHSSS